MVVKHTLVLVLGYIVAYAAVWVGDIVGFCMYALGRTPGGESVSGLIVIFVLMTVLLGLGLAILSIIEFYKQGGEPEAWRLDAPVVAAASFVFFSFAFGALVIPIKHSGPFPWNWDMQYLQLHLLLGFFLMLWTIFRITQGIGYMKA